VRFDFGQVGFRTTKSYHDGYRVIGYCRIVKLNLVGDRQGRLSHALNLYPRLLEDSGTLTAWQKFTVTVPTPPTFTGDHIPSWSQPPTCFGSGVYNLLKCNLCGVN
jgi:hypothetical protein